jgi:hypothetical protein
MVDVRVSIAGVDPVEGLPELASWLGSEPELRGRVKPEATAPTPGELGAVVDVLVAAVGGGGAVSVLAGSLRTYLSQPRHSEVRITVEGPDGRRVELDAKRVHDVEALVRQVLGQPE